MIETNQQGSSASNLMLICTQLKWVSVKKNIIRNDAEKSMLMSDNKIAKDSGE